MRLIDITGQVFGRLTVLSKGPPSPNGGSIWHCRCECGAEVTVNASNLRNGATKSCGCLATEWARHMGSNRAFVAKRAEKQVRHGQKRRSGAGALYKTWLGMKRRCSDPKCKEYPTYGGRGIRVCERWNHSFEAFRDDMGPKPLPTHQIDRIDSNGNYEPSNCRWATPHEQATEHRRGLKPVTVGGIDFPNTAAACHHFKANVTMVFYRLGQGHDVETAILTPRSALRLPRTRESYLRKTHSDRAA